MTLDEARERIGAGVVYRPHGGPAEDGDIVSVGDQYVMVRYVGDRQAKATRPEDLEPLR
jgi:hypothetical protein